MKTHVDITQIYEGLRNILLEQHSLIYTKEQAPHSGTRGTLHENIIRGFLSDHLPQKFYMGSGQVIASASNYSKQIDIVIFDAFNHPVLLPKYEIYPIEGTLAVIEVKTKLNKASFIGSKNTAGALPNIESAKKLYSFENQNIPRPLGIIFAFEASIKTKKIAEHWVQWNQTIDLQHRTDIIYLLKENHLLMDTNRINKLYDDHQISTYEPISSIGSGQIVCLESPCVLLFFMSLLLRELRIMSSYTQELTATPSNYLKRYKLRKVFSMFNAEHPTLAKILNRYRE